MFGDYESEQPRVGSPWDSLLSGSPSPSPSATPSSSVERDVEIVKHASDGVPKLVPEIEEGNVEYKLKLINPSPERFAKLVTQLKWRLGAGGGQAYYEIGVADSGQLIGLQRKELEQSLETLEMMAGEIGASVIVVKEIEVPRAMLEMSARTRRWIDGPMCPRKRVVSAVSVATTTDGEGATTTEAETASTDADADDEDLFLDFGITSSALTLRPPEPLAVYPGNLLSHMRSHPDRPTAQSSPALFPVDDNTDADADVEEVTPFSIDLEIASVYKPRPTRRRTPVFTSGSLPARGHNPKSKVTSTAAVAVPATRSSKAEKATKYAMSSMDRQAKAALKRIERDQRREAKQRARMEAEAEAEAQTQTQTQVVVQAPPTAVIQVLDLDSVTIAVEVAPPSPPDEDGSALAVAEVAEEEDGPRSIVEVLIVRKLSLEESFLDFGGFSLEV